MTQKKSLACKLGFHMYYGSTVFGITVRRCHDCPAVYPHDKSAADDQDRGRALARHYQHLPSDQILVRVLKDLAAGFDPRKPH